MQPSDSCNQTGKQNCRNTERNQSKRTCGVPTPGWNAVGITCHQMWVVLRRCLEVEHGLQREREIEQGRTYQLELE